MGGGVDGRYGWRENSRAAKHTGGGDSVCIEQIYDGNSKKNEMLV